ncbi:hypothetical protein BT96DRAFT_1066449 [Gymnopus androsaceus JB14]|uniref:Uncharacterized protein n=1 Tax=Gymnopus androsaceus JB14 TaxID=1447944 RepID=A0A6A4GX38_9AGAR|nr:hypothetical protein BT96DRAFT_1066449 [Gymnopus androsaceus JB14]
MHEAGQLTPALLSQILGLTGSSATPSAASALPHAHSLVPPALNTVTASTPTPPAPSGAFAPVPPSSAGFTTPALPPVFSTTTPAAPYNSMSMLQSVAQGQSSMPSAFDRTRRDHANATLPKKAPRTKAAQKPSLTDGYQEPKIEDCLDIAVLPSGESTKNYGLPVNMVYYTRQEESFFNLNDRLGLNIELPLLPLSIPLSTVLNHITEMVRKRGIVLLHDSDMPSNSFLSSASLLPIQLLSFTNLGRKNSSSHTPCLQIAVVRADALVNDLVTTYKKEFVIKEAVTHQRYLVVNFAVKDRHLNPTAVAISLTEFGLGMEVAKRQHLCLAIRTYATFREDHDALLPDGYQELFIEDDSDGEPVNNLCDERECVIIDEDNAMNEEDEHSVRQTLIPASLPAACPLLMASAGTSSAASTSGAIGTSRVIGASSAVGTSSAIGTSNTATSLLTDIPSASSPFGRVALWSTLWTPPTQCRSTFYNFNCTDTFYMENKRAFLRVNRDEIDTPSLHLSASNMLSLADVFIVEVHAANIAGDFTLLLAHNRHFMIENITSGLGIESEVMHAAYGRYTDESAQWFAPSTSDFSTISTIATTVDEHVSQKRLDDLSDLGALVALNLIHGYPTVPLNPLLLEYFINDCNINSLAKDKVTKWFPSLAHLLSLWLDMSHNEPLDGNIFASHLATFHDLQLSALSQRDEETHHVMAFRMLHNAVIGKLGVQCQELQAFLKGFRLPVPGGLTFCEIARSYLYGAGAFVAKAYRFIKNFDDLSTNLEIKLDHLNSSDQTRLSNALIVAPHPYQGRTFEYILKDFFEETGIPCPTIFEHFREKINPVVPISEAETSSTFCLRMFTWAVGGAPFLRAGSSMTMEVILVLDDDDRAYISTRSDEHRRTQFLLNGVCSYKTCFQEMRIPASYLIHLLEGIYDAKAEPKSA